MDLGARPWQVLRDITLPVISPAILSGWLLAFTLSLDEVVITSFVTGPGSTTLPLLIWSKVKLGVTPDINALATIIVAVVGIGVIIAGVVMMRADRRRERRWRWQRRPGSRTPTRHHADTLRGQGPQNAARAVAGSPGMDRVVSAGASATLRQKRGHVRGSVTASESSPSSPHPRAAEASAAAAASPGSETATVSRSA